MTHLSGDPRPKEGTIDPRMRPLTILAAELHRAKWQFDLNEDYRPSRSAARGLIDRAFDELHRIGDVARKLRDGGEVQTDFRPLVRAVVEKMIADGDLPEHVTYDDRGLGREEYVSLFLKIASAIGMIAPEEG